MVISDKNGAFKETSSLLWRDEADASPLLADDLSRDVYGLLGIPLDASDRVDTLHKIQQAADSGRSFLLSTPNVNFLVESQRDPDFRETLLQSDHCCPDGMPLVWLCRFLGIPVMERVSGSDLFEALRAEPPSSKSLKVFLFGGGEGAAEIVCGLLNERPCGIRCVGHLNPGFGTVEAMSSPFIIERINSSRADFLAVFLNAKKAQRWLHQNRGRLKIPVMGQFGATINYQAGLVRRAPVLVQRLGLEWLWRVKEEPYLWRRYWGDGKTLASLVLRRVIPVAGGRLWDRCFGPQQGLAFNRTEGGGSIIVALVGSATKAKLKESIIYFRSLLPEGKDVALDLSQVRQIDARYFGLLVMFRKELMKRGRRLSFLGSSERIRRTFMFHGFDYLLNCGSEHHFGVPRTSNDGASE